LALELSIRNTELYHLVMWLFVTHMAFSISLCPVTATSYCLSL